MSDLKSQAAASDGSNEANLGDTQSVRNDQATAERTRNVSGRDECTDSNIDSCVVGVTDHDHAPVNASSNTAVTRNEELARENRSAGRAYSSHNGAEAQGEMGVMTAMDLSKMVEIRLRGGSRNESSPSAQVTKDVETRHRYEQGDDLKAPSTTTSSISGAPVTLKNSVEESASISSIEEARYLDVHNAVTEKGISVTGISSTDEAGFRETHNDLIQKGVGVTESNASLLLRSSIDDRQAAGDNDWEPGAYAVGGPVSAHLDADGQQQQRQENVPRLPPRDNNDDEEGTIQRTSGLAVAHLVSAEEGLIPVAQQMSITHRDGATENDPSRESTGEKSSRCRSSKKFAAVSIFVGAVLTIIVAVIVVVILQPEDTSTNSKREGHNDSESVAMSKLLSLVPKDTAQAIKTDNSPQSLAANFIINEPNMTSYPDWRIQQRFALATLFHATGGAEWKKSEGWLDSSTDECYWYAKVTHGITIGNEKVTDQPFPCENNEDGVYRNLWLWNNGLQGRLPEEVFLLSNLKSLSIYSNKLTGQLPSQIGLLSNLEGLNIGDAGLSGTLPSEFWQLTSLWALVVSNNNLYGTIPTELGLLSSLQYMINDSNQFSGSVPSEVGELKDVVLVLLHSNNLNGTLPTELGLLTSVHSMDFSNRPESALPEDLFEYNNHANKSCDRKNCLTGSIPSQLGDAIYLHRLDLADNLLTSTVPTELGKLTVLENIEISANFLTGPIQSELGLLTNLSHLNYGDNMLSSTFPTELGNLEQMKNFLVYNTLMSGSIPTEFKKWNDLVSFYVLGSTELTGTVPDQFCSISRLGVGCSSTLCGCDCPCGESNTDETEGV